MRLIPASVFTTRPAPTPLCLTRRTPTVIPGRGSTKEPTIPSDIFAVGVELIFIVIGGGQVSKVDLVSQQAADATEPLDELGALLRPVRHKFQVCTKFFVFLSEPFEEGLWLLGLLHLKTCRLVDELLTI
jgi:hypothetical protein